LLADTHALIWFFLANRRLSHAARRAIENPKNEIFVSAVSGYELALKSSRGLIASIVINDLSYALRLARFEELQLKLVHMIAAGELPGPHSDPWDRILMAQAKAEDLVVVTRDSVFEDYGLRTLW
jgi:PIN domain nuclease of toxin-antitoxin system